MIPHRLLDLFSRLSRGRSENVLKTFRNYLPGTSLRRQIRTSTGRQIRTSLGRQIRTSPGRHFVTSPRRQIRTSSGYQFRTSLGWSNRIFRGCLEDIGGGRPRDVLGTNICRLGRNKAIVKF